MSTTITEILNQMNDLGVFSYAIPFLLIFAVVFALLKKTKILGEDNDGVLVMVAVAMGLLSLQFDIVSEFFAVVFPRFGVGLSLFLVLMIFIGFFMSDKDRDEGKGSWIGFVIGIGTVVWAISEWDNWNSSNGFGGWFADNIWAILILGGIIGLIAWAVHKDK